MGLSLFETGRQAAKDEACAGAALPRMLHVSVCETGLSPRIRKKPQPLPAFALLAAMLATPCLGQAPARSPFRALLRFGKNIVAYDFEHQRLDVMRLKMKDGRVTFRVIVDRPMYEIWGGADELHRPNYRADGGKPISEIRLMAEGGQPVVKSFTVYPMKPIWKD